MTSTADPLPPGGLMAAEIGEQAAAWQRLLDAGRDNIAEVAARIAEYGPRTIQFVGRGTSEHAGHYAKYLVENSGLMPTGTIAPSTMTVYGARLDLSGTLVIAVSQSGGSPDLVTSLESARAGGALTLAVTNNPWSPLAKAAELTLDIHAGPEHAVAATKTYTAELLALYLLVDRMRGGDGSAAQRIPDLGAGLLDRDADIRQVAQRYRFVQRLIVTGRGFSYPTAREAALKLMETCYISAQAFSGADLLHGPLATIDSQVPVIAVVPTGAGGEAMRPTLGRLAERNADVFGIGGEGLISGLAVTHALPEDVPEELTPLLAIIPLQQLALHLAIARGEDPDRPRSLHKVTETL